MLARNAGFAQRFPHRIDQRIHLILMRLRGKVRIFAFALQRIAGRCSGYPALPAICAAAVEERDADTQRAEINSCDDRHAYPCSASWLYMLQPR